MPNAGKDFEDLAFVIAKCLHERATVKLNDKIRDRATGRLRQIDISIRVKDGPTEFLAIVEARDKSRPVGVEYVEQVKAKAESVGANKAILISNKGFYSSAKTKAQFYGIDTYSIEEALRSDWSQAFRKLQGISVHSIGGSLTVYFLDDEGRVVNQPSDIADSLSKEGLRATAFFDEHRNPKGNFQHLINLAYKAANAEPIVSHDITKRHPVCWRISVTETDKLFFWGADGIRRPFKKFAVWGEIWSEVTNHEVIVRQYKDAQDGHVHAEILGMKNPGMLDFELVLDSPNEDRDRKLFLRTKNIP